MIGGSPARDIGHVRDPWRCHQDIATAVTSSGAGAWVGSHRCRGSQRPGSRVTVNKMEVDPGLLILRATIGLLFAGHGA
jgi:hypothetical protein